MVRKNNKQEIFNVEGGHTFFIPIDEGFEVNEGFCVINVIPRKN